MTDVDKRKDQYLAKAGDADEQAAKSQDEQERVSWHRIAEGWRGLAKIIPKPVRRSQGRHI
jgi:hypothetical protein